jgi:PAS domain S-box-containing protein
MLVIDQGLWPAVSETCRSPDSSLEGDAALVFAFDPEFSRDESVSELVPRLTDAETALRAVSADEAISSSRIKAARVLDDARHALLDAQEALRGLETRALTAEAVEAHARRFRKLIDNCAEVLILCSAEGIVVETFGSFEEALGYPAFDQVGRALLDLVHPGDQSAVAALFASPASKRRLVIQYRMQRQDGAWRWFEGVVTNLLEDSDVRCVVFAQRDVSERINARGELRIAEERSRTTRESDPEAVLTLDLAQGTLAEANENAARLLGYSREQLALDLLTKRCAELASEFAVWAQLSETAMREADVKATVASALEACFDAEASCVGALYLLDEQGALVPSCLGADCGWSEQDLATFFGQEVLLRRTMQWGVSTELPSAVVPEPVAQELLRRSRGSAAVIVPLRYRTTSLGACVIISRTRASDRDEFRNFAHAVASQITQVLALASAFAEKERLRRQAADQAKLLRLILDSMGEGVLVADRTGRIVLQNPAALSVAATPPGTTLRERPAQLGLYHSDGTTLLQPDETPLVRATRGERMDNAEVCQRRPGSDQVTHFRVTARPLTTEDGELQGGVIVIHDVTEQKKAYEEVLASRQEWQSLVEHVPDFIFKLDASGTIRFVNRVHPGFNSDDFIGIPFGSTVSAEYQAVLKQALGRCLTAGERSTCEVTGRGPGGSLAWYSLVLAPIRQQGALVGALAVVRETTQQKLVEAQLAASDRMASLGALATGLAHEINNPLSSLIVNLTLATRDVQVAAAGHPRQQDLLDEVRSALDAAERVRQIVLDLRLLAGRDEDRRGAVDIEKVLESTLRLVQSEVRTRAKIVRKYTPVPRVEADESRLGQVLLNLILNAAQAIPEGKAQNHEIRIGTRVDANERVIVEIEDNGQGMSAEVQARAFEPFFTTKPRGAATGLGLSICQRIVSQLGGTIEFDSRVGLGTTFRVALPAAQRRPAPVRVNGPRPAVKARRGRVLIVDDDETVTGALSRVLSAQHELTCVDSAQRALELLTQGDRFDVVLCDLLMPQVSGMELYAEVMRLAPEQAGRFVFTTGGAYTPSAQDFLDSVQNPRIEKPFDVDALTTLVRDLVA